MRMMKVILTYCQTYVRLVYKLFMHKHCDMTVGMLMHNRTDINFSSLETV